MGKPVGFRWDDATRAMVQQVAESEGIPFARAVNDLIREGLKERSREQAAETAYMEERERIARERAKKEAGLDDEVKPADGFRNSQSAM